MQTMWNELCLYLELFLFLAGILLYGFLSRELLRRPDVLPGNRALRWLSVSLTLWFAGALTDALVEILLGAPAFWRVPGVALDVLRGFAWLGSFVLLVHTLADALGRLEVVPYRRLMARAAVLLAYPSLLLFADPTWRFIANGEPLLVFATRQIFPLVLFFAAWNLALAWLVSRRLQNCLEGRRLRQFLRYLTWILAALFLLMVVSYRFDPWNLDATGVERLLRSALLSGLLLPGFLLAFFVQRYNVMRLSLSQRSLRHFLGVLVLVFLVMLAGPTVAREDLDLYRRLVAWGLLLALFFGTVYTPVIERWLRRFPHWRRLMGKNLTPQELDRLMDRIQRLDLHEDEALRLTAHEVGRWLGSRAEFLTQSSEADELQPLWEHFRQVDRPLIHRLAPPNPLLASLLTQHDLHAVFALRIENELRALLGLRSSATGGGYDDGELEAVRLVIRQLAATLSLQRLVDRRLAEERRLEEQERLGMLGLISASLAHEIKNPLAAMKALAQSLREDLAEDAAQAEGVADLDVIVEQIDRLHQTTQEILGIARPRPGADAPLTDIVHSALYILSAEARKRGVHLKAADLDDVGDLPGSAAAWQTVVFNLMLNAVEHTPAGGTATIQLRRDGDQILFTTSNPGGPLSDEKQQRIFEPFVSEGGTGLGLALVRRRLDALGGEVSVHCRDGHVIFEVSARDQPPSPQTLAPPLGDAP